MNAVTNSVSDGFDGGIKNSLLHFVLPGMLNQGDAVGNR